MGKGDDFERECCRYLSLWWSEGERDDIFWRNRRRITSFVKSAERQLGDIAAVRPEGIPFTDLFNIEIKIGYAKTKKGKRTKIINWDLLDLIDSTKVKSVKVFWEFWKQTTSDSEISKRLPMLIFSRDYRVPVVAMYTHDLSKLSNYASDLTNVTTIMIRPKHDDRITLMRRDDFFTWIGRDAVMALHQEIIES